MAHAPLWVRAGTIISSVLLAGWHLHYQLTDRTRLGTGSTIHAASSLRTLSPAGAPIAAAPKGAVPPPAVSHQNSETFR